MIDIHSHILPGIDDGSSSIGETKELLLRSYSQGVHHIVATPHFYASHISFDKFLSRRERAYKKVCDEKLDWPQVPEISVGAEVYFFPNMSSADRLTELCTVGTDIILIEMPFAQWQENVYTEIKNIIKKRKLFVIIAHVERYYEFQKKKDVWNKVMDLPVIPQLNTGAFLNRKSRKFCLKFMKEHDDILLGSDCHNMNNRLPNLPEGREIIEKKFGRERLDRIDALGERIFLEHTIN
ncbi:MAG: capsular polysaccharide biosynthesis protein [Eubacterium sp.]|nr:capsular polysaccharide biosynthesis protein [Eubacterium sp.]